jgi:hypothetical protein
MIEDMKLAGLAATTQEIYLQAVRSLAKHYNRSPELLAEEEVRRYLLDVRERNARGIGPAHYPAECTSQTRSFNRACAPVRGAQTLIRFFVSMSLAGYDHIYETALILQSAVSATNRVLGLRNRRSFRGSLRELRASCRCVAGFLVSRDIASCR